MEDNDTTARPASARVVVVEMGRGGMLAVAVRPADSRASLAHAREAGVESALDERGSALPSIDA
jgi:hypothetical protein